MSENFPNTISQVKNTQSFNPDKPSPFSDDTGLATLDNLSMQTRPAKAESGVLYIVATPIGNLRDITLRALDILSSVDEILAEDTRQSRKLLDAYRLKTPLSALHDYNESGRIEAILNGLSQGRSYAQISDAGTPLVSDPGYKVVGAAIEAGYSVIPLPGASAVLAALITSGLPSNIFTFGGFLPSKSAARLKMLERFKSVDGTLLFFETAKRIEKSLKDVETVLGDRPAALARELTKKFEETRRGTVSELIKSVKDTLPRGEIVLILGPSNSPDRWDEAKVKARLKDDLKALGVKRASLEISQQSGWSKRDVYQLALSLK